MWWVLNCFRQSIPCLLSGSSRSKWLSSDPKKKVVSGLFNYGGIPILKHLFLWRGEFADHGGIVTRLWGFIKSSNWNNLKPKQSWNRNEGDAAVGHFVVLLDMGDRLSLFINLKEKMSLNLPCCHRSILCCVWFLKSCVMKSLLDTRLIIHIIINPKSSHISGWNQMV